mmetsp:Transcript_17020/g.24126  ORF Transcript_17020/g.24126 Transcript_17020/m.24126 type:complete len:142 (+) Transcript_17020:372-797(+)
MRTMRIKANAMSRITVTTCSFPRTMHSSPSSLVLHISQLTTGKQEPQVGLYVSYTKGMMAVVRTKAMMMKCIGFSTFFENLSCFHPQTTNNKILFEIAVWYKISPKNPNIKKKPCAEQEAEFPTAHSHPVSFGVIHVPKKK